jgi:hypothetical protein
VTSHTAQRLSDLQPVRVRNERAAKMIERGEIVGAATVIGILYAR